jgi:hypothetical protein
MVCLAMLSGGYGPEQASLVLKLTIEPDGSGTSYTLNGDELTADEVMRRCEAAIATGQVSKILVTDIEKRSRKERSDLLLALEALTKPSNVPYEYSYKGISDFDISPPEQALHTSTRTGKYFRVICHFKDDAIAAEALTTAEQVWPVAAGLLAVSDEPPDNPHDIHLYRTAADYEKAEAKVTAGKFNDNQAFAHWETQTAYIAIQPGCSDDVLQHVGLPAMTRRLIAHEAAHLVRYATMPNFRSHPAWLADGAASWVEERVMIDNHWSSDAQSDPTASTMILQTSRLLANNALPTVDDILGDKIDNVHWRERYAVRWMLLRFLKSTTKPEQFRSIMNEARRLGGGADYAGQLTEFTRKTLGPERLKTIDDEFQTYIRAQNPVWNEVFRSLETAGSEWTQIAFPDTNAIAWQAEPMGTDAYVLTGECQFLPSWQRQLNVLVGYDDKGFVSIAMAAGGSVTVFVYNSRDDTWKRVDRAVVASLLVGPWMYFRVDVAGNKIRVALNGKEVLDCTVPDKSLRGPWGLGAQAGAAGHWRNVKAQPLAPKADRAKKGDKSN